MTLPYHGLADRMNTEHEKLRAEDLTGYADTVVDIARGLGERVTMAGISCGALITGWAAQVRQDLDRAVLISPGFAFKPLPGLLTPLMGWVWRTFPNGWIWDDPEKKEDSPRPQNYLRMSTRVLGEILRLSEAIQALARKKAPAAREIVVVTNLHDPSVDNRVTDQVVGLWRTRWARDVRTWQFPAELGLGHDIIDVADPHMNVPVVYPKLLELMSG